MRRLPLIILHNAYGCVLKSDMPNFKLTFNSQHNYVHAQFLGVLTDSDFRECLEEVNRLYPGINTITDLSELFGQFTKPKGNSINACA